MVKDYDYYASLDLDALAKTIPADRYSRLRSESLNDIITAIYYLAKKQTLEATRLHQLLGSPDTRRTGASQELWEYDWIGKHDEIEFQSKTSFKIVSNKVVGLEKEI